MIYLFFLLIGLQIHCYHFTRPHDAQEHKIGDDDWPKIVPYNADFAFHLYKEMSSTLVDKNILFSPLSISIAFAMLSLGATSKTQRQIYKGLTFNLSEIGKNEIHKGFYQLIHKLNLPRVKMHMKIGNAVFLDKSLDVLPTFLDYTRNLYHAEDIFTDFLNSTRAKQQINNYVNNKTTGKTVNTVKDLSIHTRMVFVNYIFFKAYWRESFHHEFTCERDFLAYGNTTVKLNMMWKHSIYRFLHDEDLSCSVVEVSYSGDVVAWFILPDEGKLKDVESSLVKEDLDKWRTSFEHRELQLQIPKFSISASSDVVALLQRLGVTNANLPGIARKHNLRVAQALHEAVLVVHGDHTAVIQAHYPPYRPVSPIIIRNHLGKVIMRITPPPPPTPPPPLFITFNRPFLMVIIDTSTGTILLMGKIVNPTKE